MSFYSVQNKRNFNINQTNTIVSSVQDSVKQTIQNPLIVYATFSRIEGEFRINPMNLQDAGTFYVTQPSTTQTIDFVTSSEYSRVIGTISFDQGYRVEQPAPNTFRFVLSNLVEPFFGSISLMVSKN
jgi:hypothetical protein